MNWIKTSEQMPEAYNPILLYHRLNKEICIGYWRALTGVWWIFNYGVYSDEDVITHWMPLPELPEEVSKCQTTESRSTQNPSSGREVM